jgi:hypothetical protein
MNDPAATTPFPIYPNASTFPGGVIPPPTMPNWANSSAQQMQQPQWPYGGYGMAPQPMLLSPQQQQQHQQQMAAAAAYYYQRAQMPPAMAWTYSWWLVPLLLAIIIFLLLWHFNLTWLRSSDASCAPASSTNKDAAAAAGGGEKSFSTSAMDAAAHMASAFHDGPDSKARSAVAPAAGTGSEGSRSIGKLLGVSTVLAMTGCAAYLVYRHFRARSLALAAATGGIGNPNGVLPASI